MISWPEQLIQDIARRRAVFFLGAGVSKGSRGAGDKSPPLWREFLDFALSKMGGNSGHIKKLIKANDLLTACEALKDGLGQTEWNKILQNQFTDPRFAHTQLHELIFQLDLRVVLTQNFDKIYDTYAQHTSHNSVAVKNYYDDDLPLFLRGNRRAILKVHGTIDEPSKMIFTRHEYAKARYKFGPLSSVLDSLILTHTFVFMGCSLADPDIQIMLEKSALIHPSTDQHYLIGPKRLIHKKLYPSLQKNFNIKFLEYDPKDNHSELTESTKALVELVEIERETLKASQDW